MSPASETARSPRRATWFWKLAALCTFFPVTAVLHHRIFVRPHCMTNLLSSRKIAWEWITSDPSPWLGLVAGVIAVILVARIERLRFWVAAIPLAFFPLDVWLWDVPGTSIVCPLFHDGKIGVRSWHLYLLGIALYLPIVRLLMRSGAAADETGAPGTVDRIPAGGPSAVNVQNLPRR